MNNLLKSPPLARVSKNESSGVQTYIKETVLYKPVSFKKKTATQIFSALGALEAVLKAQDIISQNKSNPKETDSIPQYQKLEQLSISYLDKINGLALKIVNDFNEIQDYFENKRFALIFPKSCKKIFTKGEKMPLGECTSSYLHLNEVSGVALQLQNCLINEEAHRFIPHQLALLFRCIEQSKIDELLKYQARIEAAFDPVTAHVSQGGRPLPKKHVEWLDELASDLVMTIYYSSTDSSLASKHSLLQDVIVSLNDSS